MASCGALCPEVMAGSLLSSQALGHLQAHQESGGSEGLAEEDMSSPAGGGASGVDAAPDPAAPRKVDMQIFSGFFSGEALGTLVLLLGGT